MLDDEVGRRADAAHGEEDVVGHEVRGEPLDLLGEGRREEVGLALSRAGHVLLRAGGWGERWGERRREI